MVKWLVGFDQVRKIPRTIFAAVNPPTSKKINQRQAMQQADWLI